MCTLLFWPDSGAQKTFLLMNRDESLARPPAVEVRRETSASGGSAFLYPRDPEGGGTWIGVNSRGVVLALLNEHPESWRESPGREFVTRGRLIPEVLRHAEPATVAEIEVREDHLAPYRPFRLVAVDCGRGGAREFVWDGNRLEVGVRPPIPYLLSSSPLNSQGALAWREGEFESFARTLEGRSPAVSDFLRFSQLTVRDPAPGAFGISFREDTHGTVSTTLVVVPQASGTPELHYRPGTPHLITTPPPTSFKL